MYYYIRVCNGGLGIPGLDNEIHNMKTPRDLYIITTAKKRDDLSWMGECAKLGITSDPMINPGGISVKVDSWNNIAKYVNVYGAFFIFDEQRLTGSGPWVKSFYKISKKNQWILLSATPGDSWPDYIPVFIANGFYKNKTEFNREHVIYCRYTTYPLIEGYINEKKLRAFQRQILVNMEDLRTAVEHHIVCPVEYNKELYRTIKRDRWNFYDEEPIQETGKLCYLERKVTNSDPSRVKKFCDLVKKNDKAIIFYNFDYELEIIRKSLKDMKVPFSEWNGHVHDPLPEGERWMYIVQYTAGCEGWNCTSANVIIFYSQNYSYKVMTQAAGRINRMNTPYKDLYYYHLRSYSQIDLAIKRALSMKKDFNERSYAKINKNTKIEAPKPA